MQQLLHVAAHRALPKTVVEVLIELTYFFRQLCSKVNMLSDFEHIQDQIVHALCHLEKIFPLSFLDVMEHLFIHLIVGVIQFRWMYTIERFVNMLM